MVSHCQGLPLSMAPSCHAAPRHQSPLKDVSARRTEQHEQSEVPGAPKDRVSQAGPLISPLATRTAWGKPPCSDQAGLTRAPGSLLGVLPLHPVFPPPRSTWSPPSPHPLLLHFSRPPGLPGPHSAPRYYVGLLHLPEVRLPWSSASLVSAEAPTCFTPLKTGLPRRRHGGWASEGAFSLAYKASIWAGLGRVACPCTTQCQERCLEDEDSNHLKAFIHMMLTTR